MFDRNYTPTRSKDFNCYLEAGFVGLLNFTTRYSLVNLGWFLLGKVWNFKFCMLPNCSHLLTDFRTAFVFGMYALCVRDLDEHAGSFLAGSTLISRVEELLWAWHCHWSPARDLVFNLKYLRLETNRALTSLSNSPVIIHDCFRKTGTEKQDDLTHECPLREGTSN